MSDNTCFILAFLIVVIFIGMIVLNIPDEASSEAVEPQTTQLWRITAYCPCSKCCGRFADGITASGAKAQGKLIAAPKEIPFGTWIDIPSYGIAEVLDRGGAMKKRRLDLLFETHQEALNWGVKYLRIDL